jgi:hypothetical protein
MTMIDSFLPRYPFAARGFVVRSTGRFWSSGGGALADDPVLVGDSPGERLDSPADVAVAGPPVFNCPLTLQPQA